MKIGSLFDGSGGFPLAAQMCGIEPVWASEIEPFPIRVTKKNFPKMKHLGDVTNINGYDIEPVDIISFGSPCQDLSIAGKRKGLIGERSGLFMEAVRIIKEMRGKTDGKYPAYAVWENVPGAFSSNGGEDFRIVLEELSKIAEDKISIPRPKNKWNGSGEIVADKFSIAYRTFDAQFWGVPQRRRRIYLIADFGGERAGKILFERQSLQRDFKQSEEKRGSDSEKIRGCTDKKVYGIKGFGKYKKTFIGKTLMAKDDITTGDLVLDNFARRFTPLECCRMQGFPDDWCEGVEGSDSAQYKMWGNGIALPCALYVMEGIAEYGT